MDEICLETCEETEKLYLEIDISRKFKKFKEVKKWLKESLIKEREEMSLSGL